jgi:hypothetical protein
MVDTIAALALYPLALLKLMAQEGAAPLGMAKRIGMEDSEWNLPAHRVLQALIEHAPSPESIARELLEKLGECKIQSVKTLCMCVGLLFKVPELIFFPMWFSSGNGV